MLLQCCTVALTLLLGVNHLYTTYSAVTATLLLALALVPQVLVMFVVSPRVFKNHVFVHSIAELDSDIVFTVLETMVEVTHPHSHTRPMLLANAKNVRH